MNRRQWIVESVLATQFLASWPQASQGGEGEGSASPVDRTRSPRLRYCLNTSTIAGQNLSIEEQVEVTAKAGYDGIEPWIRDVRKYVDSGGNLRDLRQQIVDAGLTVESAIGFAHWVVDDAEKRSRGLEDARRDMELVRAIGGTRIAAPPAGATDLPRLDLHEAAARYRALLEVGRDVGVTPMLELWGFSKNLSRLGELAFVAVEAGHPDACLLLDIYHIYKGGSDFTGLSLLDGAKVPVLHMNDYPSQPPRHEIGDQHRVYPGEGVAPIAEVIDRLRGTGFVGTLSLELFNREYWKHPPLEVAKRGLQSLKQF